MSETVVEIVGRLESGSLQAFQQRLSEASAPGARKVLLDLSRVSFIGSAGLRAILVAAKQIGGSGGRLAVLASAHIADVFTVSGIDTVLPVRTTLEQARDALAG